MDHGSRSPGHHRERFYPRLVHNEQIANIRLDPLFHTLFHSVLKGGSIQSGVLSTGPDTLRAEVDGYVRLADVSTLGLVYPLGPFAARQAFLKSQPDLISRFIKAYIEGIHRFRTDKAAALATLEKQYQAEVTPASEKIYEVYAAKYFKRVPEATPEGIQTILQEISATLS